MLGNDSNIHEAVKNVLHSRNDHYHSIQSIFSSAHVREKCITPVENAAGSLINVYISFRTNNFPLSSRIPF
jgi:4-diphosphocytidyl-2C-methyl-D-erythritol kinase